MHKYINFSFNQISSANINIRFIQETKASTTNKKQTRGTVERSFFNLLFSKSLNIRKYYYKPQQFALLKLSTVNDTVIISVNIFFQEHFQENEGFLEIFKQLFRIPFPKFSLSTNFPLTINY